MALYSRTDDDRNSRLDLVFGRMEDVLLHHEAAMWMQQPPACCVWMGGRPNFILRLFPPKVVAGVRLHPSDSPQLYWTRRRWRGPHFRLIIQSFRRRLVEVSLCFHASHAPTKIENCFDCQILEVKRLKVPRNTPNFGISCRPRRDRWCPRSSSPY